MPGGVNHPLVDLLLEDGELDKNDGVPVECPECGTTVDAQVVAYFGVCPADRCRADRDAFEADALEDADL